MTSDLQARLEQALRERDEARADNAALLQALLDVAELRLSAEMLDALAAKLRAEPHPGAALLREVLALRPLPEAATRAAAELRHAFIAKDDWNLVARAIRILETASAAADAAKEKP